MRSLMTAGPAALRDNTAMYNCSYLAVKNIKSFDQAMFILLCGTGVGFSVERQYINKLPESARCKCLTATQQSWLKIAKRVGPKLYVSLLLCCTAVKFPSGIYLRFVQQGARLKTFGGRASGPAPLIDLFNFVVHTFKGSTGRKLSSIECHDIMCKIGEVVVVGGVRRSAMISLS